MLLVNLGNSATGIMQMGINNGNDLLASGTLCYLDSPANKCN